MAVLMILLGILRWIVAYLMIGFIYVWITKADVKYLTWVENQRFDDSGRLADDKDYNEFMKNDRWFRTQVNLAAIIVSIVLFPAIWVCDKRGMFK